MGNIDSRMSLFRIFQAVICKCTVQSNSALPVFAAHFSGCWGHSQPCQWAVCYIAPSPVMPRKNIFFTRVESLPVTSHLYARMHARTDNYNLSIMIVPDLGKLCDLISNYMYMCRLFNDEHTVVSQASTHSQVSAHVPHFKG